MCAEKTFTSTAIAFCQFYLQFASDEETIKLLCQLGLEISDYNDATASISKELGETKPPSKSNTAKTGADKLIQYCRKLEKSNKDYKFCMEFNGLGVIPGHSSECLKSKLTILDCISKATSDTVKKMTERKTKTQQPKPVSTQKQADNNNKPSYASQSKKNLVSKDADGFQPAKVDQQRLRRSKTTRKQTNKSRKNQHMGHWDYDLTNSLREIRLILRTGRYDVSEEIIKQWASNWQMEENKLTIVKTGENSYGVFFKSRTTVWKDHIPHGIKYENYRSRRMPLPLNQKNLSTKLYLSRLAPDLTIEQIKEQLHHCYQDIDQSKTDVIFLGDEKRDAKLHKQSRSKAAFAVLVSSKLGTRPYNETNKYLPFRSSIWRHSAKPPRIQSPMVLSEELKDFDNSKISPGAYSSGDIQLSDTPRRRTAPGQPGENDDN